MNVKESHIVTGMSRDSAVSQQNPNLVYDANNIRITTRDNRNTVLSVTNERGTKQVTLTSGTITGTPLGSAAIGNYIVIFTHEVIVRQEGETDEHYNQRLAQCDHIYRCTITSTGATVATIFQGNAGFDLQHPIETLPVFETETIQKVYWVDGIHQPRCINIIRDSVLNNADKLNFSREVVLNHDPIDVTKESGGGVFPTGTIQYMFSYYDLNGQESRIIDISPMFYLSPQERGAKASDMVQASFKITLNNLDTSFQFIRIYAVIRTMENADPVARLLGDFPCKTKVTVTDNGAIGSTINAASLYFIGGEECIAGTIAQKDNTLFLGDITLTRPNLIDVPYGSGTLKDIEGSNTLGVCDNVYHYYCKESTSATSHSPHNSQDYYDYTIDNNRSSYYIKRFKWAEYYRLGFIAQYKNGQWSDPLWLDDMLQNIKPDVGQNHYATGRFNATIPAAVVTALKNAGYRRIAPVVAYPHPYERQCIAQGIVCPTVYNSKDRKENAPYAQSSWFFRYGYCAVSGWALAANNIPAGEIQCLDAWSIGAETDDNFYVDGNFVTFHTPDVDCSDYPDKLDMNGLVLYDVAMLLAKTNRIVEHFITLESTGINTTYNSVINMTKNTLAISRNDYGTRNYPLYFDGIVDNNNDEVQSTNEDFVVGYIVYPWHRSGSLNNQKPLTTKQKQNGFTARTAMLKRNVTATSWFCETRYNTDISTFSVAKPSLFNADQLSAVRVRKLDNTNINYYGNIDKVLTSSANGGKYYVYNGWFCKKSELSVKSPAKRSEEAITIGYNSTANTAWHNNVIGTDIDVGASYMEANDPINIKYKSAPHLVMSCSTIQGIVPSGINGPVFRMMELRKSSWTHQRTNNELLYSLQWIRCGDSVILGNSSAVIDYMQGDCYVQRYDCLKTYAFTNEDVNSVIEVMSCMLETYVNLDFRYDTNRGGTNNYALNPTNFNLFNHAAYEQTGNFFTYRSINPSTMSNYRFPNVVTWSLEKKYGEDVDTWASVDVSNTVDLDGAMGNLTKLINYNNDIYAFQSTGFAQLLFNSRVQIPASDGVPIEITNGMKMQGKRYISTKIGCTNKWSIVETPLGLYFIDDVLRTTYLFNGQLQDISTTKGMKSWMNEACNNNIWNPQNFNNCKAFYDKVGKDVYWVYDKTALVYSEILGQYMSFMDYGGVPLIENAGSSTFAAMTVHNAQQDMQLKLLIQGEIHSNGYFIFTSTNNSTIRLTVTFYNSMYQEPAVVNIGTFNGVPDITVEMYTADLVDNVVTYYTFQQIITAVNALLPSYLRLTADSNIELTDHFVENGPQYVDEGPEYLQPTTGIVSPFWELGTGEYNMFFGKFKPYYLTFISNGYPTENKIFNNVEWRDIVSAPNGVTKPLVTFDHIRVWNENQDTQPILFTNSISENSSRQPISHSAATSNLRKKFNVWRCQIPRDKKATNTSRARISNPWCYIKLSRDNMNIDRHQLTDMAVEYFM